MLAFKIFRCRVFPKPKNPVSFGQICLKILEKTQIYPKLFKDLGIGHFNHINFYFLKKNPFYDRKREQKPKV